MIKGYRFLTLDPENNLKSKNGNTMRTIGESRETKNNGGNSINLFVLSLIVSVFVFYQPIKDIFEAENGISVPIWSFIVCILISIIIYIDLNIYLKEHNDS